MCVPTKQKHKSGWDLAMDGLSISASPVHSSGPWKKRRKKVMKWWFLEMTWMLHTAAMTSNIRPMHDPAWIGEGLPRSLVEDLLATDGCWGMGSHPSWVLGYWEVVKASVMIPLSYIQVSLIGRRVLLIMIFKDDAKVRGTLGGMH